MSSITEEIKSRIDLVELIGRSVQLRRVGSRFRGLCPFHAEKTPSFYVNPQTHSWHCFGCNRGGTAFDWLMEREHLEFGEALRQLASMANVSLPEYRSPEAEEQTRRLFTILERAQMFYEGLLNGAGGARARDYLAGRGLKPETQRLFGMGLAPQGNALLQYLQADGFSEQELQAAGVIGISDDGRPYDFFRDRVLFPIRDVRGRTIAFGGRAMQDGVTPKYLNSRDTLLFHKHETLFAIDLARRAMLQEHQVVIVEGYMDAAMAHQHGYRNVVATLGTAITDRHLRSLRRQVDEIVLALDADAAGQAATWRALQVADESLRTGLTPVVGPSRRQQRFVPDQAARLRVLALPGAKDPDELIRADPQAWPGLVKAAVPVVDFILQRLSTRHDLSTAQGKAAAAEEIADVLANIANPIEQTHYLQQVADLLRVDETVLRRLLLRRQRWSASSRGNATEPAAGESAARAADEPTGSAEPEVVEGDTLDEYALALLMRARALKIGELDGDGFEFALPQSRALARLDGAEPPAELRAYAERVARWSAMVDELPSEQLLAVLERTRLRMRKRALLRRKEQLGALLREASSSHNESEGLQLEAALDSVLAEIRAAEQLEPEFEQQKVGIA